MESKSGTYDLAVAYRIYPGVSKAAVGLPFSDSKYQLSEACLKSFVESLGHLRVKIWALLDGCPAEYERLFRKYVNPANLVVLSLERVGNRATFAKQIDILLEQRDSDLVYFAEDDYFYLPDKFPAMLDFLTAHPDAHFITPMDCMHCYTLDFHRRREWIKIEALHHWRTVKSTCLTFLTRKCTLLECESVFRSYSRGNDDCSMWLSLTKHQVFNPLAFSRYLLRRRFGWNMIGKAWLYGWRSILFGSERKVWAPIPGIATHLGRDSLSPNIDWCALMQQSATDRQSERSVPTAF
jgi:hypothetical protein